MKLKYFIKKRIITRITIIKSIIRNIIHSIKIIRLIKNIKVKNIKVKNIKVKNIKVKRVIAMKVELNLLMNYKMLMVLMISKIVY